MDKKIYIGLGVIAVVIAGLIGAQVGKQTINLVVSAPAGTSVKSDVLGASAAQDFTNLTALALSGDLSVGGTSTFSGGLSVGGSIINAVGAYAVFHSSSTQATATSTPCAIQNTSGRTRTILDISYMYVSTTSPGTFGVNAGTSTTAFVTSTSPLISSTITSQNGTDVISTTATVQTVYAPWRKNEWLVFKSSTTTNAGNCYALYY